MSKLKKKEDSSFDFVVIGGGITGSVASYYLTKLGLKVALIEKTDLNILKQGESLTPKCKTYLNYLDFYENQKMSTEYFGINSIWSKETEDITDFIYNPYGMGISVNKIQFEKELLEFSRNEGTTVFLNTKPKIVYNNQKGVSLDLIQGNKIIKVSAKLVINATGRNTGLKYTEKTKTYFDSLIALTGFIDVDSYKIEKYLYIESTKKGWFYSNILPENKLVLSIFTDGCDNIKDKQDFFLQEYADTEFEKKMKFINPDKKIKVKAFDARTSWSNFQFRNNILELGDSSYTIDPLSGQGIQKNIEMINFFIENIETILYKGKKIEEEYYHFNLTNFNQFITEQSTTYQKEKRWSNFEFWKRRH